MRNLPSYPNRKQQNNRSGMALLVVLFLVSTVSILALSFAIKADTSLSCGENVEFRMDMDYLGMTALNYAKAHVLNPQDVTTGLDGYWQGGNDLQMVSGDDYFDIEVVRSTTGYTPECTFDISAQAYRLEGGSRISESKFVAQLRMDPFIAYWAGFPSTLPSCMIVYGDVYCNGALQNNGKIFGDVFATNYIGSQTGQKKSIDEAGVSWPGIDAWRFEPDYYIDQVSYDPVFLNNSSYTNVDWGPTLSNPLGIYYRQGNLDLHGDVKINGTLVVTGGHLKFDNDDNTVQVASMKNNPVIVCEGEVQIKSTLTEINGLIQAYKTKVYKEAGNVTITGGLYLRDQGIEVENDYAANIIVRGDPMKSSIKLMSTSVNMMEWSPVGGAYFKSIKRDH